VGSAAHDLVRSGMIRICKESRGFVNRSLANAFQMGYCEGARLMLILSSRKAPFMVPCCCRCFVLKRAFGCDLGKTRKNLGDANRRLALPKTDLCCQHQNWTNTTKLSFDGSDEQLDSPMQ
jgi:hypothetical protein